MESQAKGYWEKRQQILEELELTFLEPTDVGIRNALDQFWQSLQDLSKNPESEAARAVVRERALVLTETVRNTYAQFDPLRKHLDSQIRAGVVRINSLAEQIAALNAEIRKVIVSGDTPNDLFDKRDLLIEELSRLVDVSVSERQTGMIAVTIGGMTLVRGPTSAPSRCTTIPTRPCQADLVRQQPGGQDLLRRDAGPDRGPGRRSPLLHGAAQRVCTADHRRDQ